MNSQEKSEPSKTSREYFVIIQNKISHVMTRLLFISLSWAISGSAMQQNEVNLFIEHKYTRIHIRISFLLHGLLKPKC